MEKLRSLTPDQLSLVLKGHLDDRTIQLLKGQNVSGAHFRDLSVELLKLFEVPLGSILQIQTFKQGLCNGTVTLDLPIDVDSGSDTSVCSDEEEVSYDDLLKDHIPNDDLQNLSSYEKRNLAGRVQQFNQMVAAGLPCGSKPNLVYEKQPPVSKDSSRTTSELLTGPSNFRSNRGKTLFKIVEHSQNKENVEIDDDDDDADIEFDVKETYKPEKVLYTPEQLKAMKPLLVSFDVENILLADEQAKRVVPILRDGYVPIPKDKKLVIRTCLKSIIANFVKNPYEVTREMKEGLAKSLCVAYPQLQKSVEVPNKTPWSIMYDGAGGKGNIANVMKRIYTKLPDDQRKRKKKPRVSKPRTDSAAITIDVSALALLMPGRAERDEIFEGMNLTYGMRCEERQKGWSITELEKKYPHLLSYSGEVISAEYRRMCPNTKDMCPPFQSMVPKILSKWKAPVQLTCTDDTIAACFIIAAKLPHVINKNNKTNATSVPTSLPKEEELIHVVDAGTDLDGYIAEQRSKEGAPVQPYLLALTGQLNKTILKMFLVAEARVVELGRVPTIRAIDLLFKCYVVFNVHYPSSWRNFFRFLQTCFYEVFFLEEDDVPPSSQEMLNILLGL